MHWQGVCNAIINFKHALSAIEMQVIIKEKHPNFVLRKCILTKQNTIYYREHKHQIEILSIFDSRQNPDSLINIIK